METTPNLSGVTLHKWVAAAGASAGTSFSFCERCGGPYNGVNGRDVCPASTLTEQRGAKGKAAFNAAVDAVLEQAMQVSNQRGGEYQDTWALENQQTRFLDMVLGEIDRKWDREDEIRACGNEFFTKQEKRLIMVASLCDVKISRLLGGYKQDTLDDLINYTAALRAWMDEYTRGEQA